MARRGRNIAALAALVGAGALASRKGVDLGNVSKVTDEDRRAFEAAYPKERSAPADTDEGDVSEENLNPSFKPETYAGARNELRARGFGYDTTPALARMHELSVRKNSFKKGGYVKAADGIAVKGKTRGKYL